MEASFDASLATATATCRARYAIAPPSVCLSVCHTDGSVENGWS